MRVRGFRAAWRFYRAHFVSVFSLSLAFYAALVALAMLSLAGLGAYALISLLYLWVASIFWLQAPLVRLMQDVRDGRPNAGIRRTFDALSPRLGSITGGTFVAAVCVGTAAMLLVLPGLFLLARWALFIPVIVLEGLGAFRAFGRSNALVRGHGGRVMVELGVSTIVMIAIWAIGYGLLRGIPSYWISTPITLAFLALVTPPIPLMRVLSYYDLLDAAAKQAPQAAAAMPAV